jgi:hypothetical protein
VQEISRRPAATRNAAAFMIARRHWRHDLAAKLQAALWLVVAVWAVGDRCCEPSDAAYHAHTYTAVTRIEWIVLFGSAWYLDLLPMSASSICVDEEANTMSKGANVFIHILQLRVESTPQ